MNKRPSSFQMMKPLLNLSQKRITNVLTPILKLQLTFEVMTTKIPQSFVINFHKCLQPLSLESPLFNCNQRLKLVSPKTRVKTSPFLCIDLWQEIMPYYPKVVMLVPIIVYLAKDFHLKMHVYQESEQSEQIHILTRKQ